MAHNMPLPPLKCKADFFPLSRERKHSTSDCITCSVQPERVDCGPSAGMARMTLDPSDLESIEMLLAMADDFRRYRLPITASALVNGARALAAQHLEAARRNDAESVR